MPERQLVHLLVYPPGVVVHVVRYFILNFQNSKCLQSHKDSGVAEVHGAPSEEGGTGASCTYVYDVI